MVSSETKVSPKAKDTHDSLAPPTAIDTHDHQKTLGHGASSLGPELTVREAFQQHRQAAFWAAWFIIPNAVIGYDATTLGNLVGLPQFRKDFGYESPPGSGSFTLSASWTAAFPYAHIIGFCLGPLWAGWCTDRFGPKKTLLGCTATSCLTLLIQIFGRNAAVIFAGAVLTGLVTGSFPALGPAYISEILPVSLRGIGLAANNLAQVAGSFISVGVLRGTEGLSNKWAYKIPFITEYAFPAMFIMGAVFAPEAPWFLVKKGRYHQAATSLRRTGYACDTELIVTHMKDTIQREEQYANSTTYLDCFKGTNLRRTTIASICYSGQFLSGINVATSYSTYFFQLAGIESSQAFNLSLGLFGLGIFGNILSWPMLQIWGRRAGYISTCLATTLVMFLVGFLDLAPRSNNAAIYAKSVMLIIFYFLYNCGLGPLVYAIIAEIPSTKIRGQTLGVAASVSHIFSLSITAGLPYAMSPTEGNWGGKIGFLFGGLGTLLFIWAFLCLPETKNRTFEEIDYLFRRKTSARKFSSALIELEDLTVIEGQSADIG
ncbi:MFS maltose permease MalP [Colletotrichum fioriniae PJ7]|uniref:MFS maltose permease MalP n=1 Tax=Colletotrichum fioriniae PJ7 TaxID=1445577 RepID=A0A010RYI1_9PEZI|nr:MFS maltose permease MalP [Colletotrichum fioriniae PJ7]